MPSSAAWSDKTAAVVRKVDSKFHKIWMGLKRKSLSEIQIRVAVGESGSRPPSVFNAPTLLGTQA